MDTKPGISNVHGDITINVFIKDAKDFHGFMKEILKAAPVQLKDTRNPFLTVPDKSEKNPF